MPWTCESVREKLVSLLVEHLGVEPSEITDEKSVKDLGGDSLDQAELVLAFEEEFCLTISDNDADMHFQTVGSTVEYLCEKVSVAPTAA